MAVINPNPNPMIREIFQSLREAADKGAYVEFDYQPQLPPRTLTFSVIRQRADTRIIPPPERVKGFLERGAVRLARSTGNFIAFLFSMNRRKRLPTGAGAWPTYDQGAYLPRNYIVDGIKPATVNVALPFSRKQRMFPNA